MIQTAQMLARKLLSSSYAILLLPMLVLQSCFLAKDTTESMIQASVDRNYHRVWPDYYYPAETDIPTYSENIAVIFFNNPGGIYTHRSGAIGSQQPGPIYASTVKGAAGLHESHTS